MRVARQALVVARIAAGAWQFAVAGGTGLVILAALAILH
jgi:hypothetical protein